jgi:Flp pilus assembly pilin Flp
MTTTHQIEDKARKTTLLRFTQRVVAGQHGQTTTEYALVVGVVIVALATAILVLQTSIASVITRVAEGVASLP